MKITPHRPLAEDTQLTTGVMSYGGSGGTVISTGTASAVKNGNKKTVPGQPSASGVLSDRVHQQLKRLRDRLGT
jgi:hypothetical protein